MSSHAVEATAASPSVDFGRSTAAAHFADIGNGGWRDVIVS